MLQTVKKTLSHCLPAAATNMATNTYPPIFSESVVLNNEKGNIPLHVLVKKCKDWLIKNRLMEAAELLDAPPLF